MTAPIHPHLDATSLDIAYRASDAPQGLDVRVTAGGVPELPLAAWAVGSLIECINRGCAGGSEFAPWQGKATLDQGPTGEGPQAPGEREPRLAFRLTVAGVSPYFMRTMVEALASSGRPHAVSALTIVGTLPLDATPLSVRDPDVTRWLADPGAYVGAWKTPGFRVTERVAPRGASARVKLLDPLDAEIAQKLEGTFSSWQNAVLTYPSVAKTERGLMDPHCTFARTRSELFAKVSLFDHATAPTRAALINALAWFHHSVAKIAEVEIAMP